MQEQVQKTVEALRIKAPLIHNITNYVVMEVTANALLAAGASPLMAHAQEELEDLLGIASALVLNIGTLDEKWVASMTMAGKIALAKGRFVVLDPVGAGASAFRTKTALQLLTECQPSVVRGNASEILALAIGMGLTKNMVAHSKGVDSTNTVGEAQEAALALSRACGCVVSVSGAEDYVTNAGPAARMALIHGGSALMPLVTGLGCTATALTAAYGAVAPDAFTGAVAAMAVMAEAGAKAGAQAQGPGSFLPYFLDALYTVDAKAAASRITQL